MEKIIEENNMLKGLIKGIPFLTTIYQAVLEEIFKMATRVSPELNTRMRYYQVFGKKLNLDNPKTFSEKLLWLKLKKYMNDSLVVQCADKYAVREYVKKCGCGDILVPLIGAYDNTEDIQWNVLPQQFVLKWNFGCGMNFVCKDKNSVKSGDVLKQFDLWQKNKCWLSYAEMQYKYAPKKIICEEFLDAGDNHAIPDYKVYCFNGKPLAILVMHGRGEKIQAEFFDNQWNPLDPPTKYKSVPIIPTLKPDCFDYMMDCSKKLSASFPFVRCDFYIVKNKLYFGELTFTPAGGLHVSQTTVQGKSMAELLDIREML